MDLGAGPAAPELGANLELMADEELRTRLRSAWMGVGGMLEVWFGSPMHHEERDIATLTEASLPLARAFGMEWLGNWVHVLGFAGAVAAVELPKLHQVKAAKLLAAPKDEATTADGRKAYTPFADPEPEAAPAPTGAKPARGPAPTEGV